MLRSCVLVELPDVAVTVKLKFPVASGRPEIFPAELSVRPAGSLLAGTDHVTPEGVADSCAL